MSDIGSRSEITMKDLPGVVKCASCGQVVRWDEYIDLSVWDKFIEQFKSEHTVHNI